MISSSQRPLPDNTRHLQQTNIHAPGGAWIFVCCECRGLLGKGLCHELITRTEESYRRWSVVVCDLETSRMGAPYVYDISSLGVKEDVRVPIEYIYFNEASEYHKRYKVTFSLQQF